MSRSQSGKRKVINSVQRAIDILNLFDDRSPELGMTEIARALDLHKSTVSGLVYTLQQNDYLAQNPQTRKYRLGLHFLDRASILLNQIEIREIAQPHLRALRDWCDENVNLAVRNGPEVVYIERLLGNRTLGMHPRVGKRAPVYSTSLGKAILAWLPPEELRHQVAQLRFNPMTPNTITEPERLLHDLEDIRERGYAIDREEDQIGGTCVGAPVFDHTGYHVAAVSISAPVQRIPDKTLADFGRQLLEAARAISRDLGCQQYPIEQSEG